MGLKKTRQTFSGKMLLFTIIFLVLMLVFYWIIFDDWRRTAVETDTVTMGYLLPINSEVSQAFQADMDGLETLTIVPHFEGAPETGTINLALLDEQGEALWRSQVSLASLISDEACGIAVDPYLTNMRGRTLTLTISPNDTGLALWCGNAIAAGKFDVAVATSGLKVNGESAIGELVMTAVGHRLIRGTDFFWPMAAVIYLVCLTLALLTHRDIKRGKDSPLATLVLMSKRYSYLLKQLVWRDFRVKYKASVLGMFWSFLNPLLTMFVYYFVFSTLFRNDLAYFPVYLMSGIVVFSYFSEATSLGLISIVGNSALITKVYVPKFIYPLSKALSSTINLCISFIPLLLIMLLTGVPFHRSLFLLPVAVTFLISFGLGMSLILSTLNVFFRDTQFLWGVLLTMWNFLTPVFYPESIIPARFSTLYHMNPLYQILYFMRSIIIGGVSPTPITYFYCLIASMIPLLLGAWVFRRNQDRFVLHL